MFNRISFIALVICAVLTFSVQTDAQYVRKKQPQASQTATDFARKVARNCIGGNWEKQACLKAVSENNLVMASNYAASLKEANKVKHSEIIKEKCAASTAATRGEYPAAAMRSAYVECVNIIVDTASATGMLPDQSQYQLLVSAVQCLDKAPACSAIQQALAKYK